MFSVWLLDVFQKYSRGSCQFHLYFVLTAIVIKNISLLAVISWKHFPLRKSFKQF